jgi:hypothetical protein
MLLTVFHTVSKTLVFSLVYIVIIIKYAILLNIQFWTNLLEIVTIKYHISDYSILTTYKIKIKN